jgi:FHS family glucose/mannose:H+ symporter-like MFS transporter
MPLRSPSSLSALHSAYRARGGTAALHGIFFLTGLGTVVLGPVLPSISHGWHLDDRSAGLLLGAQFLGSFFGAITLGRDLARNLSVGCAAIVLGFGCVAAAARTPAGFPTGVCGFLAAGFGLGRAITSINLIAGERFVRRRASALSLLNLTWGLGALTGPVAAERTAERLGDAGLFASLSATSAIAMVCGLLLLRYCFPRTSTAAMHPPKAPHAARLGIVNFAIAFCVYGGIEASLSGWTTSLTARSPGGTLYLGASVTTSLWIGIAAGRAVAALLLLRVKEGYLLTGALLSSGLLSIVLLLPGAGGTPLVLLALGLGFSLAPVFPSLCSLLMTKGFPVGSNGRVMAATALGGAIFPWMVGTLSEKTGALQHGLWVPVALCAVLATLVPFLAAYGSPAEGQH